MNGTSSIKGSRYEWNAVKFSNAFPGKYVHFRSKSICENYAQWKNESYGSIRFDQKWTYFPRKAFENFKAFHSYLAPIKQRSTHTWTPLCSMFHSYLDPYITNVPLIPRPNLAKCSTHTWTPPYSQFLCWKVHFGLKLGHRTIEGKRIFVVSFDPEPSHVRVS